MARACLRGHTEPLDRDTVGPLEPSTPVSQKSPQYCLLGLVKVSLECIVRARVEGIQIDFIRKENFEKLILLKIKKSYQVFKEWW